MIGELLQYRWCFSITFKASLQRGEFQNSRQHTHHGRLQPGELHPPSIAWNAPSEYEACANRPGVCLQVAARVMSTTQACSSR